MENLPPSTSQQIADAKGFSKRYVKEWWAIWVTFLGVADLKYPKGITYETEK